MPKDPLKEAMGLPSGADVDWGPLPDWMSAAGGWLGGQLAKAEGSAPHKVLQGVGTALDFADIAPGEQLTAPWYQRVASGVLDPGGRVGIVQDMVKKMITGEQFNEEDYRLAEAVSGLADAMPSPAVGGLLKQRLRVRAVPSMAEDVAKKELVKATAPYQKLITKEAPGGASMRGGVTEFMRNPEAEYRMTRILPEDVAGQYSPPRVMEHRRPDLPRSAEMVEVRPERTAEAMGRTGRHEVGHAMYERLGEAQKADFKRAMDVGEVPVHPMMKSDVYGNISMDDWYNENFNHWMTDLMGGRVGAGSGKGFREFGAEDLGAVNFFKQYFKTTKGPTGTPSPLTGAPKGVTEALLRKMGPG